MTSQLARASTGDPELQRLAEEFAGVFSRETVVAAFSVVLSQFDDAPVKAFVEILALRNTREQLRSAARSSRGAERARVLFVCSNPSLGRLAANLLEARLGSSVETCVASPAESSMDVVALTDDLIRSASVVVTVQRGSACAVIPGRRYVDWSLAELDPIPEAAHSLSAEVQRRIERLAAAL